MKNSLVALMLGLWVIPSLGWAKVSAAPAFQIRKFETVTLENGMTVLWVPDSALPYVSMQLMIRSGSAQDPQGKEGLAAFTANMLEKGTQKRSALQITEDLEQIGSGVDVEVEPDYLIVSTSSLSFNKDSIVKQFVEILLQPTFTNAEIERFRKQVLGGLKRIADHPEQFSQYLMAHFMFGSHPYGHESSGTPRAISGIKRVDLQKFYAAHFTPKNAVLAVVGQYDEAWKAALVKAFEKWKVKPSTPPETPDFPAWKGREILLVDRADLNQAQIQIGFKGIPRNIAEFLELRAALKILGESFGSRLFEEIRSKRGLTYHIHAWFEPRLKPGPMGIYTFTRVDKIGETIEETLKTYKKFVVEGVTDSEVETVKALMRGQFPRTFETPEGLAKQLLLLNRYGISADYLTFYLRNLELIGKESINAAIRKYFDPENLRILVYAPKDKAESTLKALGPVQVKPYLDFL